MKKKNYVFVALSLTGLILLIAFGCDKEDEVTTLNTQESNALVFEDPSLEDEVSPNFYDNHIYRMEVLGENQEKNRVLQAASESGVDMSCLNVSEVQKYYFNHTEVIMYSISTNNPEQSLILYERFGLYQASIAEFGPAEGGRMQYSLRTLDDRPFYSFKLDSQSRIGEFVISENESFNSFNSEIYFITLETSHRKSTNAEDAKCCRREASWEACLMCSLDACNSSWVCRLTGLVAGPELAAALAASCIGAGPNTWC